MSKHLRFGKLLGMLAIMLTLSFAWGSAQNTSSAKQLLTFGFTTAANPAAQLGTDVAGVINQTTRTVAVTVPFSTVVTALKATFTSSQFSNVFFGASPAGVPAVSGVTARDYTLPVILTVEAENFSYENYVITVSRGAASTANDMLTFAGGWAKPWTGTCPPNGTMTETSAGTFAVNNVTFPVPYGTDLHNITVHFTLSPGATCDHTTFTIYDFDVVPAGGDGIPEAIPFVVTSQSGTPKTYNVLPVVGAASEQDQLLGFAISTASSLAINHVTQTITATVPYSTVSVSPTWTISPYAHMYGFNPPLVPVPGTDICSGTTAFATPGAVTTVHFWIQAEDPSEISEYVLTVTKAAVSTAATLTAIDANYSKNSACGAAYTGNAIGTIGTNTVLFNVPYGVTSVTIHGETFSALATTSDPVGTVLDAVNNTIVITAEDGVTTKTYTVTITPGTASNNKQLLTYGFHKAQNDAWLFPNWPGDIAGVIDQTRKHVTVTVPYYTDLHDLIAYFTTSDYACVSIAESNLITLTPQVSDVTNNDFSNNRTYVVTAEDGTQERYDITVIKATALTGNDLIGFQLTGLPLCYGGTYSVAGTYTGTNIAVSVKSAVNVAALTASFTVSDGATVSPAAGVINFTNPVTFTVTSQAGVAKTYTVTVTPYTASTEKKLLTYWFDADYNSSLAGTDAVGTVDEAAKKVSVWIPWAARTAVATLKGSFTLSSGAVMTHSEDSQVVQTSGVSANDFTTPVAYTVWAEDCTSVEYFVTVNIIPNVSTGISAFTFNVSGCGCNLVNRIDEFARRIYITLPYTVNITSLAPSSITVTPGAVVELYTGDATYPYVSYTQAVDWTKGPITYRVTAPDGVTKANWTVIVTNPPCKETKITSWSFATGQIGAAAIDTTAHTVNITVANGTNLHNMSASIGLSCGATICCNMGACAGTTIDFSDALCHTCVITAQDQTVTQDWTVCVNLQDIVKPEVTTWSVMAYNCTDSVAVQSNELGRVFIVHESAIDMSTIPSPLSMYNLADWASGGDVADLVAARLGAWATVTAVDTPVYVQTNGLYSGFYWAFAVDASGNISCISVQRLYLDICDVDVATLCDLRDQPDVWRYRLTEEVFVTYEETRVGGNWKFVQDDECGILIEDRLGALPSTAYGEGAGLTNLKGTLYYDGITLKFIPVCCYLPTKSSTGNVVTPIEITYDDFYTQCYYDGANAYESMLVKIITPMIAFDDYHGDLNWMYDNLDLATINAAGNYQYFIQSVFNSSLIGTPIPTVPAYYTGVRTNVDWGWGWDEMFGLITPRKAADITLVSGPILFGDPNPASITGVDPGSCGSTTIRIYNEGATLVVNNQTISGVANITALYLDDAAAVDGFNLVAPPQVPFTIAPWAYRDVTVNFCPLVLGNKSTVLVVEYGVGQTLRIPINGSTSVVLPFPFCEDFEHGGAQPAGWVMSHMQFMRDWYDLTVDESYGYFFLWYNNGGSPAYLKTPAIDLSDAQAPSLTFNEGTMHRVDLRVEVSTDNATWAIVKDFGRHPGANGSIIAWPREVDLSAYKGQVIFVRFYSTWGNYFAIDNVCVQEKITWPIMSIVPSSVDFGGVQLDATATQHVVIKNIGASVLKIKGVQLVQTGSVFGLTDTNTYPIEVTNELNYAYAINGGTSVEFDVTFTPTDLGVASAKVVVTYDLYEDKVVEIPLTGEGLSCYTAAEVFLGRTWAPSQNTWFKFTAEKFSIVTISSCDPNQDCDYDAEYAWDTYLYLYADCEGTLIESHDDIGNVAICPYNRAASQITRVMEQGETVYIFWPLAFPDALYSDEGFYFNITATYPLDGDVCQNAIPLTLPVVNHFGSTTLFNDDYDASPCSPYSNYMDGNDKVYTITLPYEGYLTGNILGAYGSIHVLDVCPTEELEKFHCKAFVGGPMGGQFEKKIAEGTYFVIISTWSPPQTVDYLLNMSFRGTGVDESNLTNSLSVYPNPTSGVFTVSISNAEATDMTIELVNISGQVVYRNEVKAAYNINEEIDASQFAKGVYYLKVNDGTDVKVEKVVLQ